MSWLSSIGLAAALLLSATPAWAQDALGGGAAFDDEWDAILKLAPPSVAATDAPQQKGGRTRASDEPSERVRSKDREASAERKKERISGVEKASADKDGVKTRGSTEKARSEGERGRRGESESLGGGSGARAAKSEKAAHEARSSLSEASPATREPSKEGPKPRSGEPEKADKVVFPSDAAGGYEGLVRSWHEPWPAHAGDQAVDLLAGAAPVLSLHPVGKATTPYVLLPNGKDGGFNEAQIAVASQAFGDWPGGPRVSARLLDLIYRAAQHFKVFHVHLVSGIRNDRSGSRHSHGLAADIVLPGVSDEQLAAYFRPQGFLGVGIYTLAGFVHVDVREKSYFWLDKSPPGRRTKIIAIRGEEAKLADEAALQRGQNGNLNPPRLQKALHARAKHRMEKARASQ